MYLKYDKTYVLALYIWNYFFRKYLHSVKYKLVYYEAHSFLIIRKCGLINTEGSFTVLWKRQMDKNA